MFDFLLNSITNINWREPLWLILTLQPLFLWLVLRLLRNRQQQLFADAHLLPYLQVHENKTTWQGFISLLFSRNTAYTFAWFFFALSLAGPRLPDKPKNNQNEIVLDVMLVVDLSRSMLATDIKPSRLRRATLEVYDFLSLAKNARIGITVYAARPHLFVPLTSDFKALNYYLNNLDTLQLPTLGSDANAALSFATKQLLNTKEKHQQVLLWLSDGDIESKSIPMIKETLSDANESNINTYILGLGTLEGGAIPIDDGGWLESEGQAVITKMDSALLQQLSTLGNGKFQAVTNDNSDWDALYQNGMLATLSPPDNSNTQQWKELFPWTLFPAIILLLIALFPMRIFKEKSASVLPILVILVIAGSLSPLPVLANETSKESLNDENYYSSVLTGIDAYKNTEYAKSTSQFINSVLKANTNKERGIALHNLGNALFKMGNYSSAAEVFTDALRYAPNQLKTIENQKLSIEIYTLIEKRKNRKSNRGNFAAPDDIAPLSDLPEQIPFMLSSKAVMLIKASLPDLPEEELDRLLSKEMQQFQLMQGNAKQSLEKQKQHQDIEQARIHFMGLEESTSNDLWKRLFEIEEGFSAKLKEPEIIPKVRSW